LRFRSQWPPGGLLVMAMSCDVPCVIVPQPAKLTAARAAAVAAPITDFM
jgi:hypothetical protein